MIRYQQFYFKGAVDNIIIIQYIMSKRIFKIVPPELNPIGRKDTSNIHKFINNIPYGTTESNRSTGVADYVKEELQEYPFSNNSQSPREDFLKNKIKETIRQDPERKLLILSLKLEKKLCFHQLQQLREVLPQLSKEQFRKHQRSLSVLVDKIIYTLQLPSSEADHVIEAAALVVKQIQQRLSTKASQLN